MKQNQTGITTGYPSWHNKPLRLTIQEIKHPLLVLNAFFDFCSLPQARSRLQDWLFASFYQDEDQFTYFKDQIERLVEASWLIFEDKSDKQAIRHPAKQKRKPPSLQNTYRRPIKSMDEITHRIQLNELKAELQTWCETALCSDGNAYDSGKRRDGLITLCRALPSLIEALYLIHNPETEVRIKKDNFKNVQIMDINQNKPAILEEPNIPDPIKTIQAFCIRFERNYVRTELWNILDAVIMSKRTEFSSRNPLIIYECLLSLTEMAYARSLAGKKKREKANKEQ